MNLSGVKVYNIEDAPNIQKDILNDTMRQVCSSAIRLLMDQKKLNNVSGEDKKYILENLLGVMETCIEDYKKNGGIC